MKIESDSKKYYRPQVKMPVPHALVFVTLAKSLTISGLSLFIFKNVKVGLDELPRVLIQILNHVSILILWDKASLKLSDSLLSCLKEIEFLGINVNMLQCETCPRFLVLILVFNYWNQSLISNWSTQLQNRSKNICYPIFTENRGGSVKWNKF